MTVSVSPRVAFVLPANDWWTAGIHHVYYMLFALRSLNPDLRPKITLLVSPPDQPASYDLLKPCIDDVLISPQLGQPLGFIKRQALRLNKRLPIRKKIEHPWGPYLRRKGIQALFIEGLDFGPGFGVPLLSWIPDFQHFHLPEMFSEQEIRSRTQAFRSISENASRVILSSRDALQDYTQFAPQQNSKARVLNSVAQVPQIYDQDSSWVCAHYDLPERFIYLPNQFWKHKNHLTVIKALEMARHKRPAITIVCTGHTVDYRSPLYFSELLATVSSHHVRDNIVILGFVPRLHVFHLMRQSQAVLQPSLFEGWGCTVEEARSLGKRLILSNIPVHQEKDISEAAFFDPLDVECLADTLVRIFDESEPGPDYRLEAIAREQLPERTRESGQDFLQILSEVAG